jgi:hypothetical protein
MYGYRVSKNTYILSLKFVTERKITIQKICISFSSIEASYHWSLAVKLDTELSSKHSYILYVKYVAIVQHGATTLTPWLTNNIF